MGELILLPKGFDPDFTSPVVKPTGKVRLIPKYKPIFSYLARDFSDIVSGAKGAEIDGAVEQRGLDQYFAADRVSFGDVPTFDGLRQCSWFFEIAQDTWDTALSAVLRKRNAWNSQYCFAFGTRFHSTSQWCMQLGSASGGSGGVYYRTNLADAGFVDGKLARILCVYNADEVAGRRFKFFKDGQEFTITTVVTDGSYALPNVTAPFQIGSLGDTLYYTGIVRHIAAFADDLSYMGELVTLSPYFYLEPEYIFTPVPTLGIINVSIGQSVETDTSSIFSKTKLLFLLQSVETDTAFVSAHAKSVTFNQSVETNTATLSNILKSIGILQASGTNTSFAFTKFKVMPVGLSSETDTAQEVSAAFAGIINQALETDTSTFINRLKAVSIAQSLETDTAFATNISKLVSLLQSLETDTAFAISATTPSGVGLATEANTAQAIDRLKSLGIGQVTETDTATIFTINATVSIGQSIETDAALTVTFSQATVIGQAVESDLSLTVTSSAIIQAIINLGIKIDLYDTLPIKITL